MNELLKTLLAALRGASGGSKAIAVLVGTALLGIVAVAGVVSRQPHFELAFSGLTDHELAEVCKALSEGGIAFRQSQPPGPFVVYVDESERSAAYTAVYGAGALDKPLKGILADSGVASVFHSAEERSQGVRKREWEEMEKMLEELDFVATARVRSSPGVASPFLGGPAIATTASVTLRVQGAAELTKDQAQTVANLVSRGLGIAKEHLMISDQSGRPLYDGEESRDEEREIEDLLAHQTEYDARLSGEATAVLEDILGPNKARVTVSSNWDFAQSTTRTETALKGPVVQETTTTSEKPVSLGGGGEAAGVSANTLDPDSPANAIEAEPTPTEPLLEKTSEERKEYSPSKTHEERVRFVPELERLSIALFLDQSVDAARKADLEAAIKASVGFVEERDEFRSVVLAFNVPPAPDPGAAEPAQPAEPNRWVELLLERGLEIACGLVFLVLLVKSLKSARKTAGTGAKGRTAPVSEEGVDPEVLARVQVEELLKSDPARVGEILSRWAREEPAQARS